ncbi:peptidoglycan editing factor PgeF [Ramlibacter sp. RBP-2]|uniref:Purine nucleoside phosphorylase n=1 Tax=Ramlibacter lithotrophicus TaxID=2606681 RepID=A0A7X6DD91_9BURK|nr:peptidoglycan editing factor PgeF [Ramlibacter lithotrophicus]NKE65012.1 peptidoglycan editing factor PgeF [Ramlibacter lithotrophicus]
MQPAAGWIIPDCPLPAGVQAVCTTREGGVSAGPYASLNLGDHVGDAPEAVSANRRIFAAAVQARPVFLQQVHGRGVAHLSSATRDGVQADACVATEAGIACTIMVADCLPVLFATADGKAVAAAHAGWRGLAGSAGEGVLEAACRALWAAGGAGAADTLAWLGPCIGPQAFEVGAEVKAAFEAADPGCAALFMPYGNGKWLADLPGLARRRLRALGIERIHGNDGGTAWCTVADPSRFFSHRRDRGLSGRFAAAIWRR